ncbi:cholecystokinin/sulfakinin-1 [Biomphalaria glabrata]|nr:cholecystokinin/sulfakinin-1 [Biomphalaria glabrata]
MESHVIALAIVLFYACATYAHPPNSRREDFKQLVSLLGKLKDIDSSQLAHQTSGDIVTELQDSVDPKAGVDKDTLSKALLNRYGMMVKRQGEWSYDYGLGGGRFGKRNYGDYGIGGGRFGRDVDHVDLSDANDPDLLS